MSLLNVFEPLVEPITDLVKTYFPPGLSPEQQAAVQAKEAEMQLAIANLLAQAGQAQEAELTKRLQADMASDSWLSKNVRPLVLVFLLALYTLFAGFSMYFTISPEYVQMLKDMLTAAFGFYFVSRGIEKVTTTIAGAWGKGAK